MRYLPYILFAIILLSFCGCNNPANEVRRDPMEQYRDTLIGNFNGLEIDTLIAEPIDSLSSKSYDKDPYGGNHYKWRVFTKNNTVKEMILDSTIGIHFVSEGDINRDGKTEWGFITDWPTSNWMTYHVFTNNNGEWCYLLNPTSIWLPHIESGRTDAITPDDILQTSENSDYIRVKFSDIRNDEFCLIDTLVKISNPPLIAE